MRIFIVGDVYLGRRLSQFPDWQSESVFQGIKGLIQDSDLAVFNLEGPITEEGQPIWKTGPNLKMSPGGAVFLKEAGFNLATLANNHIFDFGEAGLSETIAHLEEAKLDYLGAGNSLQAARAPYVFKAGGRSVGILNFAENEWSTTHGKSPGANPIDLVNNFRDIRALKKQVDFVVVVTHGGHELSRCPSPAMRERLRFYVEAGANAVLNHHQHVVSGFERYLDAPIFYGLGNCLFDGGIEASDVWCAGIGVTLTLSVDGVDFDVHHFDQCRGRLAITSCSASEAEERNRKLQELNKVIADDDLLEHHFLKELQLRAKLYRAYLFPVRNRYLQALHNRGLFPSLLSRQKKRLYLNLTRCESHREALTWLIEQELGD